MQKERTKEIPNRSGFIVITDRRRLYQSWRKKRKPVIMTRAYRIQLREIPKLAHHVIYSRDVSITSHARKYSREVGESANLIRLHLRTFKLSARARSSARNATMRTHMVIVQHVIFDCMS